MSFEGRSSRKCAEALTEDMAFKKILRLVTASEQSTSKLSARLERDGFGSEAIENAIARAVSYGYVDDMRYADSYVRTKLLSGCGSAGIERDLFDHGIDPFEVESFCEHMAQGEEIEIERAVRYLDRKPPRSKNLRDGAFRKLVQHGYSVGVASKAAAEWTSRQVLHA